MELNFLHFKIIKISCDPKNVFSQLMQYICILFVFPLYIMYIYYLLHQLCVVDFLPTNFQSWRYNTWILCIMATLFVKIITNKLHFWYRMYNCFLFEWYFSALKTFIYWSQVWKHLPKLNSNYFLSSRLSYLFAL